MAEPFVMSSLDTLRAQALQAAADRDDLKAHRILDDMDPAHLRQLVTDLIVLLGFVNRHLLATLTREARNAHHAEKAQPAHRDRENP